MAEKTPQVESKKSRVKKFIQKILGKKPITSIVILFFIVVLCLLLGFSKETIEKYEDAIINNRNAPSAQAPSVIPAFDSRDSEIKSGEYTAFTAKKGDKAYVVLKKGEEEKIVDEGKDYPAGAKEAGFYESFADLKFSSNGNYLLYITNDYERVTSTLYDVKSGKEITEVNGAFVGNGFDVTPDEKYFYVCVSIGIGVIEPIVGKVYSLPDYKEVFDATGSDNVGYMDNACAYDQERNAIVFSSSSPSDEGKPQDTGNIFFFLE